MPIARLDLGQNPYLRDSVKPIISLLPKATNLHTLLVDRAGLSDSFVLQLFDVLPATRIQELSIAHNSLSSSCFERMAGKIKMWNRQRRETVVTVLDLSNNKIGDRVGIVLLEAILESSNISRLGLSKTGLGYKLGVWLLKYLRRETGQFSLRSVVLNYNSGISVQQKQQIARLLEEKELESMGNLGEYEEREETDWAKHMDISRRSILRNKRKPRHYYFARHSPEPSQEYRRHTSAFRTPTDSEEQVINNENIEISEFSQPKQRRALPSTYQMNEHSFSDGWKSHNVSFNTSTIAPTRGSQLIAGSSQTKSVGGGQAGAPVSELSGHDDLLEPIDSHDESDANRQAYLNLQSPQLNHPFYARNQQIAARSINKIIRAIGPIVQQLSSSTQIQRERGYTPHSSQQSRKSLSQSKSGLLPKATDMLYLSVRNKMHTPRTDVKRSKNPNLKRATIQGEEEFYAQPQEELLTRKSISLHSANNSKDLFSQARFSLRTFEKDQAPFNSPSQAQHQVEDIQSSRLKEASDQRDREYIFLKQQQHSRSHSRTSCSSNYVQRGPLAEKISNQLANFKKRRNQTGGFGSSLNASLLLRKQGQERSTSMRRSGATLQSVKNIRRYGNFPLEDCFDAKDINLTNVCLGRGKENKGRRYL